MIVDGSRSLSIGDFQEKMKHNQSMKRHNRTTTATVISEANQLVIYKCS